MIIVKWFDFYINQYLNDLAKHHESILKTLLRYVRFIIDFDIIYERFESNENSSLNLKAFSNSNYVANKLNRKSILEYVYMFVEESIAWMSRKQKSIVTFIIEIEYMTLFTCAKKDLWIAQLLRNLDLEKYLEIELAQVIIVENVKHKTHSFTQLFDDNQAINFLVKNAHISERFKHIDVTYHHVKNLYNKNLIRLNYILTKNMIVDDFTKSLLRDKFKGFVKQLRLKINES